MSLVSLAQLVAPAQTSDIVSLELSLAQGLGLPTTAWQPLSMVRTILAINAPIVAQYSGIVNNIAQGGYASYAALMVDAIGNPITSWMDLVGTNNYNTSRVPIAYAAGNTVVNNGSATSYPYSVGQLHFQNPATGATYTNTGSGTIAGSTSGQNIAVTADAAFGGTVGTAAAGVVLSLITPLPGVTSQPLTLSLVGANAETNQAYLTRCQNKLGTLSVLGQLNTSVPSPPNTNGPPQAYDYVCRTIPQASVASAVWPYAVTSPITRTKPSTAAGNVTIYVANAAGTPPAGDITALNAAIQALCVPQGITATCIGAAPLVVAVTYAVYVNNSGNLTTNAILNNISTALALLFSQLPIGGVTGSQPNIIPINDIIDTIFSANGGTVDVVMYAPTTNTSVAPNQVPELGTVTGTVVLV